MTNVATRSSQRGATLIISLLVLLLLTLLGIASMRTTVFEEQMSGNERDRELAFQAAEAALSFGEEYILQNSSVTIPTGTPPAPTWPEYLRTKTTTCSSLQVDASLTSAQNTLLQGTCGPLASSPFNAYVANWQNFAKEITTDLQIRKTGSTSENYDERAKFFIELIRFDAVTGNYYFRVTAKGYGGDTSAEVMLQSVFAI